MGGSIRKRASNLVYVSPNQLTLPGFETPFERQLTSENRWVKMVRTIPWDQIVAHYDKLFSGTEGRRPIGGRVVLGALMIKHIESLTYTYFELHLININYYRINIYCFTIKKYYFCFIIQKLCQK